MDDMDDLKTDRIEAHQDAPRQAETDRPEGRRPPGFWDRAADLLLSLPAGIGGRLGG